MFFKTIQLCLTEPIQDPNTSITEGDLSEIIDSIEPEAGDKLLEISLPHIKVKVLGYCLHISPTFAAIVYVAITWLASDNYPPCHTVSQHLRYALH